MKLEVLVDNLHTPYGRFNKGDSFEVKSHPNLTPEEYAKVCESKGWVKITQTKKGE